MRIKIIPGGVIAMAGRILLLTILSAATVQAAPFAKRIQFEQPGGERIELWGQGDEFYAVFETLDGYTVVFDSATKAYYYARLSADGNDLLSTGLQVGQGDPKTLGLTPHLRINPQAVKARAKERYVEWENGMNISGRWKALKAARQSEDKVRRNGAVLPAPPSSTTTGTKVGLCLLIDFSDDPATILQTNIVDFCNGDSFTGYGNNGSVKKYFYDNSNGLLTYSNVVTIYIRMTNPKTYYNNTATDAGANARLLIQDAITIMKARADYTSDILPTFNNLTVDSSSNVVACNVYYAGGNGGVWAMGLWPHSWVLATPQSLSTGGKKVYYYQITDISSTLELGTFCHENGHMLCDFPDLYDYTYESVGGAGSFSLMGSGANGGNPVQVDAYLKRAAGWATITELTSISYLTASLTSSAGSEFNHFYRFQKPGVPTEYYLIENRQQAARDADIKASGIAIWHVDELGDRDNHSIVTNSTHANYELTLVQADNRWHFENNVNSGDAYDLYYSGNPSAAYNNQFTDSSSPQAHWWNGTAFGMIFRNFSTSGSTMTFLVEGNIVAPMNVQASAGTFMDKVRVTWNVTSGATYYFIYRNTSSNSSSASLQASTSALYYDDTSVSSGVVYYYWVQAIAPNGSSAFSAMAYGSTILAAPSGLSASQATSVNQVSLNWTGSSGATGYIIFRSRDSGSSTASEIARVSSSPCNDTSAVPGIYYYYWVKAYTIATISSFSSHEQGLRALSSPSGVSVSQGTYSSGILCSWNSAEGAISYLIWRSASADLSSAVNISETADISFVDTSATPGIIYYYWVKSKSWSLLSAFSGYASGWRRSMAAGNNARGDLDGDGIMDFAVYQEATGMWYARLSGSGYATVAYQLGSPGFIPVSCDYDGDGHTDPTVYYEPDGLWIALLSASGNTPAYAVLGGNGFKPVAGDFDGDGRADAVVYQEATGTWKALLSKSNYGFVTMVYGGPGCRPVVADYDGDGLVDPAVYYELPGQNMGQNLGFWYMVLSGSGYLSYIKTTTGVGLVPVPADYDGDGKADIATYNSASGVWSYWSSAHNYPLPVSFTFGGAGYTAVPADYDGDTRADIAVYHEATGQWYFLLSSQNYASSYGELGGSGYDAVGARR